MLIAGGVDAGEVVVCDSRGTIHAGRADLDARPRPSWPRPTNQRRLSGGRSPRRWPAPTCSIGVSGGTIGEAAVAGMAPGGIVFALANPTPEVHPDVAARYAAVVATGRSDFPNQINNVLAFPGVFRGALDARRDPDHRGHEGGRRRRDRRGGGRRAATRTRSCRSALDPRVAPAVAAAVAEAARREGVTR